jgi:ribosomal protein RSM22 (predicted rRNA methylase)
MELPVALRRGVDAALAGIPLGHLAAAVQTLSDRYRREVRDGVLHLSDDMTARAYLAVRLPATFAAIAATFDAIVEMRPDFAPQSLLDIGAGPGTAMWAAADRWPIADAKLIERSGAIRALGESLAAAAPVARIVWDDADLARDLPQGAQNDLVVIAYLLNELEQDTADRLVEAGWRRSADTLAVVEPGTPAGWHRILQVRKILLAAGAHLLAPCPHAGACPLNAPDWCHFSRTVARSRMHRLAKDAALPWEEEKFIYLVACRHDPASRHEPASRHDPASRHGPAPRRDPATRHAPASRPDPAAREAPASRDDPAPAPPPLGRPAARVIAPPKKGRGRVSLTLCHSDGTATTRLFTRRAGGAYRIARRLGWGDAWPADEPPPR